jgi:MerR family transcriptional regulator, light-induced transcriptional regulator
METEAKYQIKYVSKLTGLSQLLIRTWENRYNLLQPERTPTNRRLYTTDDIEKLLAIKHAIETGFKIGELSQMDIDEIKQHISPKWATNIVTDSLLEETSDLSDAIKLIINYDSHGLNNLMNRLQISMTKISFIREFIFPLLEEIGRLWESGVIKVTNEHFAASLIRSTLGTMIEKNINENAPILLIGTPRGQQHELVALAIAVMASFSGFKPLYLGSNVPTDEIIDLAIRKKAYAVLLSIIYPNDDYTLLEELKKINENLHDSQIYIGGSAAASYINHLQDTSIIFVENTDILFAKLKENRGIDNLAINTND